ncbi:hypothetical protein Tco_0988183 [Tanacetum coccineum]|uniref:Uncharacterized protein n=1 Tax=Tanacetum coccineum TaxID=301880 RepID=A0ABQ5EQL1_9ASTR
MVETGRLPQCLTFASSILTSSVLLYYPHSLRLVSFSMKMFLHGNASWELAPFFLTGNFGSGSPSLVNRPDHDMSSFLFQCTLSSLWQFICAHQPVSLLVVEINESSRVLIWSEWVPFSKAESGSFRLGNFDLLLVTFNSELKIFDSLLNNQASGEHSQCYCEVGNIIAQEICESVLNNKEKHVLDVIDTKTWKVAFLESVKIVIGSSYYNLFQIPIPMFPHYLDLSYCQNTFYRIYIIS